jgi:hypothetical protein
VLLGARPSSLLLLLLQRNRACFLPFAVAPILHLPVEDEDAL